MKIHITARRSARSAAAAAAQKLKDAGHDVVSHWFKTDRTWNTPKAAALLACQEFVDIHEADCLIYLSGLGEPTHGACHVEFGMAVGKQIRVIVIGPAEHIFHYFHGVERYSAVDEAIEALRDNRPGLLCKPQYQDDQDSIVIPNKRKGVAALLAQTGADPR